MLKKKKVKKARKFWEDFPLKSEESLLNSEESALLQNKVKYELERLNRLEEASGDNILFLKNEFRDSGIRTIEIGVLEWFESEWLTCETQEKVRFYLWLKTDYLEHFKQYVHSKNAHFTGISRQNRYEATILVAKKIFALIGWILTFFIGKNVSAIMVFLKKNLVFTGVYQSLLSIASLLIVICIFLGLWWCFKVFFGAEFTKKENELRDQKETWVRHVEAIGNYQKEMLGFLWDLDGYQGCKGQEEKEKLLMNNILNVWMKDNTKFQSNMSKEK